MKRKYRTTLEDAFKNKNTAVYPHLNNEIRCTKNFIFH